MRSLLGPTMTVDMSTLHGYSILRLMNSSKQNVQLYHKEGKHVALSGFTLANPERVEDSLKLHGVRCLGEESNIFFPLRKRQYAFDRR